MNRRLTSKSTEAEEAEAAEELVAPWELEVLVVQGDWEGLGAQAGQTRKYQRHLAAP